ncbi:MAG TPA: ABC transporter ATP-binding protein [Steroidobacteraceae bacterium]|nr:ABC transporter ATP-binding protein [Steroidobacteraceae bacterium]
MWLEMRGAVRRFGERRALDGVSFGLAEGEIGCLLGPSGCGKTTALRSIAGLESLDAGAILSRGRVLEGPGVHLPPHERGIGLVFQDHALFPHLTARGNVEFGLQQLGRTERAARAGEMLDLVGLADCAEAYPSQLSGGQQQRVAVARALAPRPATLLLDEPFSSLDVALRERLVGELRALLKSLGATALVVTHDQQDAFALADRVGLMRDGCLVQWGTPYDLYHRPVTRFAAEFVGQASFLPAQRGDNGELQTELGPLVDGHGAGAARDGAVDVLLRPDDVVHDDRAPLKARIVERVFRGAEFLYTVELPSGRRVLSLVPSHHDHRVGESIGVRLVTDHVVTFPPLRGVTTSVAT